jgi:hypothetical protein
MSLACKRGGNRNFFFINEDSVPIGNIYNTFFTFIGLYHYSFILYRVQCEKRSDSQWQHIQIGSCKFLDGFWRKHWDIILLGQPILFWFNPKIVPIYIMAALLMNGPIFNVIDRSVGKWNKLLYGISAFSRASAIYSFLVRFRAMHVLQSLGSENFGSQLVLGTFSATGGGILYIWIIRNNLILLEVGFFILYSWLHVWLSSP